jgi:hypothetical protein
MTEKIAALRKDGRMRELGQGFALLAVTGSSVGGLMGMLAVATRAIGH